MQLLSTPNEISFRLCRGGDVFCLVRVIRGGAGWGGTAESLTTAEKAFARESVEKGMRTAFLDALSDDGMVFDPGSGVQYGKEVWQAKKDAAAVLDWQPVLAVVASSGDLGYPTGSLELPQVA
jgi:hypothetical protein